MQMGEGVLFEEKTLKQSIMLVATALVLVILSGCETVKGMGRDITGVADSVQSGLKKKR